MVNHRHLRNFNLLSIKPILKNILDPSTRLLLSPATLKTNPFHEGILLYIKEHLRKNGGIFLETSWKHTQLAFFDLQRDKYYRQIPNMTRMAKCIYKSKLRTWSLISETKVDQSYCKWLIRKWINSMVL